MSQKSGDGVIPGLTGNPDFTASTTFKLIQDGHKTGLTLDPRFPTLETQSRIGLDDEKWF